MGLASHVAAWSKDPSTKVGAVIAREKRVLSLGYNGFPKGVWDSRERLENRELKYKLVQHAERNALDQAETSVEGATLYTTMQPCGECAKSIVQRGIKRVVTLHNEGVRERWKEEWDVASVLFVEGGVELKVLLGARYPENVLPYGVIEHE